MKLDLNTLQKITNGVTYVDQNDGIFGFHRFTGEQEAYYETVNRDFYNKTFSCASIFLDFYTDADALVIKGDAVAKSSRKYFSFDIFVNGEIKGYIDNMKDGNLSLPYSLNPFPLGAFEGSVELGKGEKRVRVYFPWSVDPRISEITLENATFVREIPKKSQKMLVYGDSITHGYDALRPSNHHITRLAEYLGLEAVNKGIGAEIFRPGLAAVKEDYEPALVYIAYGTNDWNGQTREYFNECCRGFIEALRDNYKTSPIVMISPIWRGDHTAERKFGSFFDVKADMESIAMDFEGVFVIDGFDVVPHDPNLFGDLRLHPADNGFAYYYENLKDKLLKIVKK